MCDVKDTENLSNIQFIYQMVQSDNMTLGNPLWKSRHSGYGGVSQNSLQTCWVGTKIPDGTFDGLFVFQDNFFFVRDYLVLLVY